MLQFEYASNDGCAERNDGAGEVKSVLREEMAEERRRLKEEHAADKEARRLNRDSDVHLQLESASNGQVRPRWPQWLQRPRLNLCASSVTLHCVIVSRHTKCASDTTAVLNWVALTLTILQRQMWVLPPLQP